MINLLTFKYWFDSQPESFVLLGKIVFIAFLVLLLVAGIVFLIYRKKNASKKVLFNSLSDFCFSNLLVGIIFLFLNYQQVQVLSARFWLLIWLIVMIIWLINISKKIKKIVGHREDRKKREEFKKYLP